MVQFWKYFVRLFLYASSLAFPLIVEILCAVSVERRQKGSREMGTATSGVAGRHQRKARHCRNVGGRNRTEKQAPRQSSPSTHRHSQFHPLTLVPYLTQAIPDLDKLAAKLEKQKTSLVELVQLYDLVQQTLPEVHDILNGYEGQHSKVVQRKYTNGINDLVDDFSSFSSMVEQVVDMDIRQESGEYVDR